MNIFYLDNNVTKCAEYHMDRHVVKMILEYCQLMSTAHRILDGLEYEDYSPNGRRVKRFKLPETKDSVIYSATHINHPSAVWARANKQNYLWLHKLTVALAREYTHRYGKVHACETNGLIKTLATPPNNIPNGKFTEPTPAMPKEYISDDDSIKSYREYYRKGKTHLASWSERSLPDWYFTSENNA